ncbi:MAG: DegT/DnrJ/EryC1/StrS aminotransferase family protein [Eubacteriales bacterium]|nr:DegT/DnrJ/EryC1/StrS aminotransferase family protein [Eubacteriales bacterium]
MKNIPFSPPDITKAEIDAVVAVLESGWITTGPKTKLFENNIAKLCKTEKAVCLSSQTACAEMTLRILGIGPGDEVIVPAYTYTATASIVRHIGATPVMIDCQKDSLEMDYDKMADAINEKTKAVIPVDLAGIMCDYDRVFEVVNSKRHLFKPKSEMQEIYGRTLVVSDAAHAFGASRKGKMCGEVADFTNFSFHAVKNLTTGEGGAVTWRSHEGIDNEALYRQYMLFSLHGQTKDTYAKNKGTSWEYDVVDTQYKCNMPDILAALGLAQLERYEKTIERRHELIAKYNRAFEDLPVSVLNHRDADHRSSGHLYFVRFDGKGEDYRNAFFKRMAQNGVICNVHFKPLPLLTAYKQLGYDIKDYPNAYDMYKNELTLPLNTVITDEEADYILSTFRRCIAQPY